jgi:hypothetical protein
MSTTSTTLLDAEDLLVTSRRATGLFDLGKTDPHESLRQLVRSLNDEACLTPEGVAAKRASLIRVLSNRLLLQHAFTENPRIAEQQISKPIVILGLPRSGTTKLHRMIAADPDMQKLPLWKLMYPVRALAPGTGTDVENRIAATEAFVDAIRLNNPQMYAGHPMLAREPDEEYFAMEISFLAHINTSSFYTPSYEAWLDNQPFDNWYVWLKKFMQYAQYTDGTPGRPWVLKAPHHLAYLPLLFRHFPDATIVHCHRDPAVVVPSFCALIGASRRGTSYRYQPDEVGKYILRIYRKRMQLYLRDRVEAEKNHPFVDVRYERIVRDARAVIAECYAAAGLTLSPGSLQAMLAWEASNEQHKHGKHEYRLADFGVTDADIASAFGDYAERFKSFLSTPSQGPAT